MLSNVYVDVDKEYRLRKWTPLMVINCSLRRRIGALFAEVDSKYSYRHRQEASFVKVDAFQYYQIVI